jgi:hypothetical protein
MRQEAELRLNDAIQAFPYEGKAVGAVRYGNGHVNDTFCLYTQLDSGEPMRYILQRINTETFKDPDGLMENIFAVTDFIADRAEANGEDPLRSTMKVFKTKDGKAYYRDEDGGCWRMYLFVDNTYFLERAENEEQFYESARAFGNFQRLLADFDASKLHETIPLFHDTRNRYKNLEMAIEKDACDRVKSVEKEIAFVRDRKDKVGQLMDMLDRGELPLRVTHNDTKLNNVLFDKKSHKAIVVIDLDTVMPGLALHDFGDSIRFGASTALEDEKDLSKVSMSLSLYEAYTRGFMETAGHALTETEIDNLPWGAYLMTFECGIRFLTDYLEGDHYFRVHRDGHNLDRARTQFKLIEDYENKWDQMHAIVNKYRETKA